jgi:hypothetical protein
VVETAAAAAADPAAADEIDVFDPLRFVAPGQATEADEPLTLGSFSLLRIRNVLTL